jgi:two-component system, LuxR family, sensor kinase FixL
MLTSAIIGSVSGQRSSSTSPFGRNKAAAPTIAILVIPVIAAAQFFLQPALPFELLYMIPIGIAALSLKRGGIALLAAVCCAIWAAAAWPVVQGDWMGRLALVFLAFTGCGFFVSEATQRRREAQARLLAASESAKQRLSTESQLYALVEGNPAAILTLDPEGKVLLANGAAHDVLRCEPQTLPGQSIDTYLPTLATFRQPTSIRQLVRTMIECTGYRCDGEAFLAHVWVSSAGPPTTTGLTAVVFDSSEQLRNREEVELHTLSLSARVIAGAFWHEARNLCSAMRVVITSMKRIPAAAEAEEMEALVSLMNGLEKLASAELRPEREESFDVASLRAVLDQFRIIIGPWFEEDEISVAWHEARNLPLVRADQHALLQVFLNLARNARRALADYERKEFTVHATVEGRVTVVRFRNSGLPPPDPSVLFQPYQRAATEHGIGLHVSRAIVRSFGGDLRYEPVEDGCCFAVVLEPRPLASIYGEAES